MLRVRLALAAVFVVVAVLGRGPVPGQAGSLDALVREGRIDAGLAATAASGSAEGIVSFAPAATLQALAALRGVDIERSFENLGLAQLRFADAAALARAASLPGVLSIAQNSANEISTADSLPFVNQPVANASGYTGEGTMVAVLDTGADCDAIAPGGACPVTWAEDFAEDDGVADDHGHGTNVSGIVAAVAPGAQIAALDVFTASGDSVAANDADVIAAIDAVIDRSDEFNIVAVNLSLGSSQIRHIVECGISPYAAAFSALRANGILPVVAAGNQPYSLNTFFNGVAQPACAPGALVVGAAYDADYGTVSWPSSDPIAIFDFWPRSPCVDNDAAPGTPACFSQTGPLLDVWGPGTFIEAAGIEMSGTSQATPHVAATVALLAEAAPGSTAAEREAAIIDSGQHVVDSRNGLVRRALELCGALSDVGGTCGGAAGLSLDRLAVPEEGWRYFYVDLDAPVGLLSIRTTNSTGDVDLFVERGTEPTRANADCIQESESGEETCVIANAAAGRWWIGVFGFDDAGFSLRTSTSNVTLSFKTRMPMVAHEFGSGGR